MDTWLKEIKRFQEPDPGAALLRVARYRQVEPAGALVHQQRHAVRHPGRESSRSHHHALTHSGPLPNSFRWLRGTRLPPLDFRRRMAERWEHMTPEEREKFREGMRGRCGHFGPPAAEPKP